MKKSWIPSYEGYKYTPRGIEAHPEIFDAKSQRFTPLSKHDDYEMSAVLDSIALAAEAGILKERKWVKQIFGTTAAFSEFLFRLEEFVDSERVHDRWYSALSLLADTMFFEFGFQTGIDIAQGLWARAETVKQVTLEG